MGDMESMVMRVGKMTDEELEEIEILSVQERKDAILRAAREKIERLSRRVGSRSDQPKQ
jgi:hypothetical protein